MNRDHHKTGLTGYASWTIVWICLVAADQLTKYLASAHLKEQGPIVLLRGVFELHYLQNTGAAFGMLRNHQWIFIVFAALILCGAGWLLFSLTRFGTAYRTLQIAALLLAAGAAGNMIDRIVHRYVIDFLYFSLIHFPIFNVADVYVCVGCGLFLILMLFVYQEEDLKRISGKKTQEEYLQEIREKIRKEQGRKGGK